MIGPVSILLAAWEAFALSRHKPTITNLSHRWPYSLFIYGWMAWLFVHFIAEGRKK